MKLEEGQACKKRKLEDTQVGPIGEFKIIKLELGNPDKTTRIRNDMGHHMEYLMVDFFHRNIEMFAWKAFDLQGIDPSIIVHRLNVDPSYKPVKQKTRTFNAERS